MYFFEDNPLRDLERMMCSIPNFTERGYGTVTVCRHEYTAKDCACRNCPYHTGRGRNIKCSLEKCDYLKERIESGVAERKEILAETMSGIRYPPFRIRLNKYIQESEMKPMDFRNEKHRIVFMEAIEKLNRKDYALMSAIYLLSADFKLWITTKPHIEKNEIRFEKIKLQNGTATAYTLFCAAKDLYLGEKHLTVRDLADSLVVPPKIFALICNAMAIRRFGIGAVENITNGEKTSDQRNCSV